MVAVWRRQRAGVHIQSSSSGISWSVWSELRLPAGVIHGLVEPLLCLAAAFLLSPVDRVLSIWLRFAALALVIKTSIHRREAHQQMLDTLDDRMSARNRHAAMHPQTNPRPQTPDVPVTVNTPAVPAQAGTLAGLFRNLDPALQRLMQENAPEAAPVTAPIHVRPADAKPAPPSQQRPAGNWGVPSTHGTVRVRAAQAGNLAPLPAAPSTTPRVVLVRTRPAPEAPLRVTPAMPPGQFGRPQRASATAPVERQSCGVVPRQWPAAVPNRSEAAPLPNPAEVRKPATTEGTAPAPSAAQPAEKPAADAARSETVSGDPGRGAEGQDTLRERIRVEAEKLGFAVEVGGQSGARALPRPDLMLTKDGASLMVQIVVGITTDQEIGNVRRCLAGGPGRVVLVCPNPEQLRKLAEMLHASVPLVEAMRVSYFTPDEFSAELVRLAAAEKSVSRAAANRRKKDRDAGRRDNPFLPAEEHKENPS